MVANGGIDSSDKVQMLMEMGVSGVMMGRPALFNPAVFDSMKNDLGLNDPPRKVPAFPDLRDEYDEVFSRIGGTENYRTRVKRLIGKARGVSY